MEIIAAKYLLPIESELIEEGGIAVEFGRIHAVGKTKDLEKLYPDAHVKEFPTGVLMPGLVNAHTHLDLSATEIYEPTPASKRPDYIEWLVTTLKRRQEMNTTALIIGIQSCIQNLINTGVTCVGDMTSFEGTFKIIEEMNLRATIYTEIYGGSDVTAQDRFESALALVEKYTDASNNLLKVGLGPLSPYLTSRHVLKITSQQAKDLGIPLATHAAESFAEMEFFYDSKGSIADVLFPALGWGSELPPPHHKTPIQYLSEIGFLSAAPSIVGGLHLGARDFSALAKSGSKVVYCPKTNYVLGNGTFPFEKLKKNGITIGIGTDTLNNPSGVTMWDELRFALNAPTGPQPTAKELLEMATIGGAESVGMGHMIGTLSAGKQADYIIVDSPPCPDPIFLYDSIIRNTRPSNVRHVVVAGDILKTT